MKNNLPKEDITITSTRIKKIKKDPKLEGVVKSDIPIQNYSSDKCFHTDFIQSEFFNTRRVLTASFTLSKEDMLEALKHETMLVNGTIYKVPERRLLELLFEKTFGVVELELTEIKK